MPELLIDIPIAPRAQARARSRIAGKPGKQFVQVYTGKEQRNEADNLRALLYNQLPVWFKPIQGAVRVTIAAWFTPPQCSMKMYVRYVKGLVPHIKKPDVDNLAKHVKDCAKGILWLDDKQVTCLTVSKAYRDSPGWAIWLEWDDGDVH